MNMELTTAEQMLYSTVKITSRQGENPVGTGTGFFFEFTIQGSTATALITNNHVVDGADNVIVTCHTSENDRPSGKFIPCQIPLRKETLIRHPDPTIDLCAINFSRIYKEAADLGLKLFTKSITMSHVPSEPDWQYFDAIEDVVMVGCPRGISDEANNLPIVRRGITASALNKNYGGKNEFMVDMACFPGSSGSPVFIHDRNGYFDRKLNTRRFDRIRFHLVGVLYSGPIIQNNGQIVFGQTPTVAVSTMMHLGSVVRASELRVLERTIDDLVANSVPSVPQNG